MHDMHATILHALGFDHERLTYRFAGRDFRLTDVYGKAVHELFVVERNWIASTTLVLQVHGF